MTTPSLQSPSRLVGVLGVGPVDPDAPAVPADDLGLTRGDGCFEATRVVTGTAGDHRIDHLAEHLDRFDRSCAGLDLPPVDRPTWCALIDQLLDGWTRPGEAMLRLLLSRGSESHPAAGIRGVVTLTAMAPETLRQRQAGIDVITLERGGVPGAFAGAPWLLGGVKTLSYAVNMAALREARRRDAHDVLFLDGAGGLLEAPTATVVWAAGRTLLSPPVEGTGVLDSITQRALFAAAGRAGWRTGHAPGTVADLRAADGCWLVSSGRGVAAVLSLDGIALDVPAALTRELTELAGF